MMPKTETMVLPAGVHGEGGRVGKGARSSRLRRQALRAEPRCDARERRRAAAERREHVRHIRAAARHGPEL